ncbi:hypothetical protein AB205_0030060 [Aquarana catesbeiana]|uniref:Uncharacterized protein n=1 Tax=Aquarana catesbeiana TaxID=8400 RepID=A0A2G9Q3C6_AQUCT|nr:hypothetical protein AB205_0030060 [Aquarana catesbeiana]
MDFLKPVLELRNMEASWEEEEEGEEEHAPSVYDDEGVSFACTNQEDSSMELQGELIEVHESFAQERDNEDTDVLTPSSRRQRKHLLPAGRKAAGQQNRLKTRTRPINY